MPSKLKERDLEKLRHSAETIAKLGGDSTLNYFKKIYDLEYKEDESPVTTADRETETIIRDAIEKQFPDHGIIGEEFGSLGEERDIVWVIDPIDGTKSFIHGIPFYTTLIGILADGEPVVGVIYAPALNELVSAAEGLGASLNKRPCNARPCNNLGDATFLTTDIKNIEKYGFTTPYRDLLTKVNIHRTWGDAYGHLMVATGRADLMFDPVLSIWDAAALLPVVTESGATYCDIQGACTIQTGNALSMAPGIRDEVIRSFEQQSKG